MTTETSIVFLCDRCDNQQKSYQRDENAIELPIRWVNVTRSKGDDDVHADTMDLCSECAESFEAWRVAPPKDAA